MAIDRAENTVDFKKQKQHAQQQSPADRQLRFEPLEVRLLLASDFADALSPYPTTLVEDGAQHEAISWTLGDTSDIETDGTYSAVADADGANHQSVKELNIDLNIPGSPGDVTTVSVELGDATGAISATFNVLYDDAVLSITNDDVKYGSLWPQTDGWSLAKNTAIAGQVRVVMFNVSSTATGPGEIAQLDFTVKAGAASGSTLLDIEPVDPNEGGLQWTDSDGSILVNHAPTLDAISDVTIDEDSPEQTVNLTSITAGGGESQLLAVTAVSSNTGVVPNPTAAYTSAGSTGSLMFTPQPDQNGTATITVTVEDAGFDGDFTTTNDNGTFSRSFEVTVSPVNDAPTGTVTISGTASEDQTLTASNTLADEEGLGAISYTWSNGATGGSIVLGQSDVGNPITVTASYTDAQGTAESMTSDPTAAVANVNDAPTGTVTISGTASEDQTLTANNTLADEDGLGAISYTWSNGATGATIVLGQSDVGNPITVTASYTDTYGAAESMTSDPTAAVANVNDAPTGTVTISGTASEDQTLTANNTLADEDGLGAISYTWSNGATGGSIVLGQSDVGNPITVTASYTDTYGAAESMTSDPTAAVANVNDAPTGTVTISGTASEDQTLTANNTLADEDGLGAISYTWSNGATGGSIVLGQSDVGNPITITASYTDTYGAAESMTSDPTAAVANVNDAPTGTVTISGTASEDQTLTANNTLADEDGLGAISYTWSNGATGATIVLGQSDVGNPITITASYTDTYGAAESMTSDPTAAVANVNDAPTGTVTISGTASEDQTLTANNTLADEDGLGAISYTWSNGATGGSIVLGQSDVGNPITVTASYTDTQGAAESMTSDPTAAVANVNDAPTGTVTISGTASEDQTLTANNTLADEDGLGAISYTWSNGATGGSIILGQSDVGNPITVTASYTDAQGTAESMTSDPTAAVANVNDAPTGTVTISGTASEDQTLTANNTLADEDGLGAISYTWSNGATGGSIVLGQSDVGNPITVTASYTDTYGAAESMTSDPTAAVANVNDAPTGTVTISGTASEDQTLTANNTLADEDGLGAISYTWSNGATGATIVLGQSDVGNPITITASYTDTYGAAESMTSDPTAAVANVNDAPTGTVTISGTASEDQTLTANNTLADEDGLGAISYTWSNGATGATIVLGQSDVGNPITVTASYTDTYGAAESMTSDPTAAVANVSDAPTGTVTISGTASEDQTLTANNTLADEDGLGAISYTWSNGATGATIVLGQSDVGNPITITASYTDTYGAAESMTSDPTAAVANVNDAPTGTVTISGTASEDQTLTANNTLADEDGLGAISYTWSNGATGGSIVLGQSDVGNPITITASYTDTYGAAESMTSDPTAAVANVNDAPTGTVTISGTASEDQTLTANNTLADEDGLGAISYTWSNGATGGSIVLGQSDVGNPITVTASYTDAQGTAESMTSDPTAAVANVNDAPTGTVTISGTASEDQTLTASNTLADEDGLGAISYTWSNGATGGSIVLGQSDVGNPITVTASYTDTYGAAESMTSDPTAAVANVNDAPTGTVTISGTASEDQTLTANNTLADEDGLGAISYTWSNGATGATIVLGQSDVGNPITITASYTDTYGAAESMTSDPTAAVANVNDAPTGTVTISGTASEDQTLTANNTLADEDGLGAISYTWSNGATGATIVLGQSDVGNPITVTASYTDTYGAAESMTSDPTAAVANVNDAPTAVADAITVDEGETSAALDGGATSVLANDSDVDSTNLTAVLVTDVANGALMLNSDGTFSYTHDGSKTTSDSFTYKANDGALDSNTVTVTVTVNPAPPNVTLVTRDSGNDTFDTLNTLAFTFDANVNITAGTLSLLNETAGGTPVDLTGVGFDYHAASMTATWDFTGVAGIDAAFYTGLLDATLITDSFGNLLDGDGDGTAGDDFSHVLLVAQIGDSDLDGDVDLADYNQLATNFDPEGLNSPHEWCDANFDTDLDVDLTDYNLLFTNFAPAGYAGMTPSLYVAPGCDVGSEPLAAASLAVADEVEPGNETSSAMRIDVPANALLPTSPERLLSESPGVDQSHDTQTTITVGRPARHQAVSAAFAQYESDRQAFGTADSSDSSTSSLELSLAEYLDQRESEHVRNLFAK